MLIGFLVIGAVAILETTISAHPRKCLGNSCCFFARELKEVAEQVTRENQQVWIIGKSDDDASASSRAKVREELIVKYGVDPEVIGELIFTDRALQQYMRERQMAIVTQPKSK
jgi:ATP-dependent protease Clp ATPase subunit